MIVIIYKGKIWLDKIELNNKPLKLIFATKDN